VAYLATWAANKLAYLEVFNAVHLLKESSCWADVDIDRGQGRVIP
jgi:hypothetical protein